MKNSFFSILFLVFCSNLIQAQCTPTAISNVSGGCAPLEVLFNCPNYNTGNATWNTGSSTVSGLAAAMIFSNTGVFTVTLTLITATTPTCVGTATLSINVLTGPANGCSNTVTGVKEFLHQKNIVIYPNPNQGSFEIRLENEVENAKVILRNALGQNVYETALTGDLNTMHCSSLSKGIYTLSIFENGTLQSTRKLVIE